MNVPADIIGKDIPGRILNGQSFFFSFEGEEHIGSIQMKIDGGYRIRPFVKVLNGPLHQSNQFGMFLYMSSQIYLDIIDRALICRAHMVHECGFACGMAEGSHEYIHDETLDEWSLNGYLWDERHVLDTHSILSVI